MPNKAETQLLIALLSIASSLKIETLAIGANARQLILDERYKLTTQRLTTDWDFAVQVESWEKYSALSQALTKQHTFQRTSEHRFIHVTTMLPIDIVPFGTIAEPDQRIEWPESEKQMSVIGFYSAYQHAEIIQINKEQLKVATLPWHVALKIIAYKDRRLEKDLFDINFILEQTTDILSERIFEELIEELTNETITYNEAGSFLLAKDLATQATQEMIKELTSVLSSLIDDPNHIDIQRHLLRTNHDDKTTQLAQIIQRFQAFKKGLEETQK